MNLEDGQQWVNPADPIGHRDRHRRCRLLLQTPTGLRRLCWTNFGTDGSLCFGFSHPNAVVGAIGDARVASDGRFLPQDERSLTEVPLEARRNPHVTLHASGVCNVRTGSHDTLTRHRIENWFPVWESFNFLHAYTDPVENLPAEARARPGDAQIPFPDNLQSAHVRVSIIAARNGRYEYAVPQLGGVLGVGPNYAIQLSVERHDPVTACLYVAHSIR